MRCWKKADLPKALHYGSNLRVPPVVCLAEMGWYITTHERFAAMKDFNPGNHGYDPAQPQMAALFIAEGPAFQHGKRLPAFDNVDIQPLMAQLLHIKAPKADGSARTFRTVLSAH
jgi:predicted AlkP superfamily pyrophosphatase or phosphodiesterase